MPRKLPSPAPAANDNVPVHTIRHRSIKATIWKNQTSKGAMYDVRITRSYRVDEQWHDTNSFGYDDLMNVAKLFADAHSYISVLREKDRAAAQNDQRSERVHS